jgi:DNA invertase Pin-like site-specific DNA recombinase
VIGIKKAALWLRVSDDQQDEANQAAALEQFCSRHGYEIARRFELHDVSAWKQGNPGAEHKAAVKEALAGAWRGEYHALVVWALDRLTRQGAEDTLRLVRELAERGCTLYSVQEPWLNTTPAIRDVLVAFARWNAQQESARKSERVKAGMARAKVKGATIGGRKAGARDSQKRDTAGYRARWERERATKAAAAGG